MTKDGRPSLINDIRLFTGESSASSSYLDGQEEAVAYARRMAWFLNGEGFSLGAYPALYLLFTSTLNEGELQVTNKGGDWWHRYVHVGVTKSFPDASGAYDVVARGVVDALLAIRPDQSDVVRRADSVVRAHGDRLRFLLKRRETKKLVIEIASNIAAWPKPSCLFITHTDKETGDCREAESISLGFYDECFHLLDGIRIQDAINLTAITSRPAISGLVKRRG